MLPRVLEPEVMDSWEEAHDYDAMDHSEVNRVFVTDFLAGWDGRSPVLDVGTGTAQIPIELCGRHPTARVVAVDRAAHMLRVGRANVQRAGLQDRLHLQLADAKGLPFPDGGFTAVMSNSIVHHIPEPGRVLAEMARVLAPDGYVFVRDLIRPPSEAHRQEIVRRYAGDANPHQQRMFADSLHAALTLDEVRTLVAGLGFERESVQQTSDRHWTWKARRAG